MAAATLGAVAHGGVAWSQDLGESIDVQVVLPTTGGEDFTVAQADDSVEIRDIRVVGLRTLDETVVLTGLPLREGDILVGNYQVKLNDAAQGLYDTGWFRSQPELALDALDNGGVALTVTVDENPTYKSTNITGNSLFTTERLLSEIEGTPNAEGVRTGARLVPGEVINARKLASALDSVLGVYRAAGYVGASIDSYGFAKAGPDEGMVDVQISEGILEEVIITGNESTREGVIRSQITHMRPGTVLRRQDIEQDLAQIYNTGLFEAVNPELETSLMAGQVKVVIAVEEAATGQAGVGLGYSTVNGLQGTVSYNEKNLFGAGKAINAQLIFSRNKPGFDINFSDPYAGSDWYWNVGVFNLHNRQQRFPGQPYESELEIDTKGANFAYGKHVSDTDTWQASFAVTDYDYTIRKGDPFRGLTPRQRARLSSEGETRKLGLSYAHDTRDNIFSTTSGFLGTATGEFAGFGGDFDFNKYTFETREFWDAGSGTVALRQRVGTASGDVPIYEEFRLGGVNSIRGVSEDLLTGTSSLLLNGEYRVPISDMFTIVPFFDYGAAGESLSDMDTAAGAGVGARVKIKALGIGAVRLDYGWELNGEDGNGSRFHFFLGEMF